MPAGALRECPPSSTVDVEVGQAACVQRGSLSELESTAPATRIALRLRGRGMLPRILNLWPEPDMRA